jgi:hypothetical protein
MARSLKVAQVEVNGEQVHVRKINGSAYAIQAAEMLPTLKANPIRVVEVGALLAACCLCDAEGKLLYSTPDEARENEELLFLQDFTRAALEYSGMMDDAQELPKNSPAVQPEDSSSV